MKKGEFERPIPSFQVMMRSDGTLVTRLTCGIGHRSLSGTSFEAALRIIDVAVQSQAEFTKYGPSAHVDLTRNQVAKAAGQHPAQLSRALDKRYIELPDGEVIPTDYLFGSNVPIKYAVAQILESNPNLISRQLRQALMAQGIEKPGEEGTIRKYKRIILNEGRIFY